MTREYIKNYSENIMLSRMMCYCIKVMFLLFLFGQVGRQPVEAILALQNFHL